MAMPRRPRVRKAWEGTLAHLTDWALEPTQLEDEGVEAPTRETVGLALAAAEALRDLGMDAPTTVVPTGDGGIVFRWRSGGNTWTVEVDEDGCIESCVLAEGRLASRHWLRRG
jgi:hypothetical protein